MSEHINIKHKVKSINRKSDFYDILNESMLNEVEKQMLTMYYIENRSLDYIADELGYSPQGIAKMHKRALKKIESLL